MRNLYRNVNQHFVNLECEFTLDVGRVKSAYRRKALQTHPDKGGTKEHFQKIQGSMDKIALALAYFAKKYPEAEIGSP